MLKRRQFIWGFIGVLVLAFMITLVTERSPGVDEATQAALRFNTPQRPGVPQGIFPPAIPQNFRIYTRYTERIELDWEKSVVSADYGAAEGYRIYRASVGQASPCNSGTLYQTVGRVSGFTDYAVDPATAFDYSVAAFNAAGSGACTAIVSGAPSYCYLSNPNPNGTCNFSTSPKVWAYLRGPVTPNWSTTRDAPTGTLTSIPSNLTVGTRRLAGSGNNYIYRTHLVFWTQSIPDASVMQSVNLELRAWSDGEHSIGDTHDKVHLYEAMKANPNVVTTADYQTCSTKPDLAPAASLGAFVQGSNVVMSFNQESLDVVETVLPGTEVCLREEHDAFDVDPAPLIGNNVADIAVTSIQPVQTKLVGVYTSGGLSQLHFPRNFRASDGAAGGVTLTWEAVDNATGYYVYRIPGGSCGTPPLATVLGSETTSYVDTTAQPGVTYTYSANAFYPGNAIVPGFTIGGGGWCSQTDQGST